MGGVLTHRATQAGLRRGRRSTKPADVDVIYWVQGTAAEPFLERGKTLTTAEAMRRLQDVPGGSFLTFAVWFN